MSPVLSKRVVNELMQELRAIWPRETLHQRFLMDELGRSLKPKRSVRASQARRVAKKKSRKEKVSELRAAVMARADGLCECGGISACSGALQMDHFFGGTGRRRALESLATCWALCRGHHDLKTIGLPDAAWWANRFIMHCNKHGYADAASIAQARRDALAIQGRTGEQT